MPSSEVMHKWKHGQLHSGSDEGPVVHNRKQAIAIMLSEKRNEARHGGKYKEGKRKRKGGVHKSKAPTCDMCGEPAHIKLGKPHTQYKHLCKDCHGASSDLMQAVTKKPVLGTAPKTRKSLCEFWLVLEKSDIKDLHVRHRQSMIRKVGAASKIAEHHGYKPGLNPEMRIDTHQMEPLSAPNHVRFTSDTHTQYYHNPKSGHQLTIHARKPYALGGAEGKTLTKMEGLDWMHEGKGHFNTSNHFEKEQTLSHGLTNDDIRSPKPLHALDEHLSQVHKTEPYSRKLRRSLEKSFNCSICKGKKIVRVIYKSGSKEEIAFRLCPICQVRGMQDAI